MLHTLIKHVQKGDNSQIPENSLDLLLGFKQQALSLSDPGVQWISFLLRNGKGALAIRAFSTFLHRGNGFSSQAIRHLCENASVLSSAKPATVFAEYISTAHHCRSLIETLIIIFYAHGKYEAVVTLGSSVLAKDGISINLSYYRRILRSIFKVHHVDRRTRPEDNVSAIRALLSVLSDWLRAFRRDDHYLAQADILILVQQLFSLLQKRNHRERPVPRAIHLWVLALIEKLSHHLSDPLAKFSFAEACINSVYAAYRPGGWAIRSISTADHPASVYSGIIRWAEAWKQTSFPISSSIEWDSSTLQQLKTKSRALKILAMDRVVAGDSLTALEHIKDISSLQPVLLQARRDMSQPRPREEILDARIRYTSTIVRVSSYYLRKQELAPLFLVLSFTVHLNDLATFVRLWKRAIHLVTQKGCWSGAFGLNALLTLLAQSVPPLWEKAVVGELLFTSPRLLETTLRVALLDRSPHDVHTTDDSEQENLIALAQKNPREFRHWEHVVFPFTGPLPPPWKDAMKNVAGDDSDQSQLERSLLDRIGRKKV